MSFLIKQCNRLPDHLHLLKQAYRLTLVFKKAIFLAIHKSHKMKLAYVLRDIRSQAMSCPIQVNLSLKLILPCTEDFVINSSKLLHYCPR